MISRLFLREASVFVVLLFALGGGLGQEVVSLPEPAVVLPVDFDGDCRSTYSEKWVFNWWLQHGGDLDLALLNAVPCGEVLDMSAFFHSPRARLVTRDENLQGSSVEGEGETGTLSTASEEIHLIELGQVWRYHEGTVEIPPTWVEVDFDDSAWHSGHTPIGYEEYTDERNEKRDIITFVSDSPTSVYLRRKFTVDPAEVETLVLEMRYDDGFVAYLNGHEVARRYMPQEVGPDTYALMEHTAWLPEIIPLDHAIQYLQAGEDNNVLAIEVHNRYETEDKTLKVHPKLIANPRNRAWFVVFGDPWRYYAAVEAPPFPDSCTCQSPPCWYEEGFDDSGWLQEGYTPIGYGEPEIVTEVPEGTRALYLRRNFTIQDHPELFQELVLYVWYDDGFVAYINGQEVARAGLDPEPCWNTAASAHERGSRPREIVIDPGLLEAGLLHAGENLIAFEVHNTSATSSDLYFNAWLAAYRQGPFLAKGTHDSIHVVWRTAWPVVGHVDYGASEGALNNTASDPSPTKEHDIVLSLGDSNKKYFYQIRHGDDTELIYPVWSFYSSLFHFRYDADNPIRFLCFGDTRSNGYFASATDSVASLMRHMGEPTSDFPFPDDVKRPRFALHVGDIVYRDREEDSWRWNLEYFQVYEDMTCRMPVYVAIGNHEEDDANYTENLVLPENSGTERYYSFDFGPVHFVSLDSNTEGPGADGSFSEAGDADQLNWLMQDMEASLGKRFWRIVFFHHPPNSCTRNDGDDFPHVHEAVSDPLVRDSRPGYPLSTSPFDPNGDGRLDVDIVFVGHKHWYERTYPINKSYDVASQEESHYVDPEGTIYVTVGGGGARASSGDCTGTAWSPKLITHVDGYSACYVDFYHTPTHAVARVRAYRVNNTGGAFLIDEFTISKSWVPFRRGDANQDGRVDIADPTFILTYLWAEPEDPATCLDSYDANNDGNVDQGDPIYLLNYLFGEGPPPAEPFEACGTENDQDTLGCYFFVPCE